MSTCNSNVHGTFKRHKYEGKTCRRCGHINQHAGPRKEKKA